MKKKLFKYAFIFSVAFNLMAVATVVYGAYFSKGAATSGSPIDTLPIYRTLKLSEEQKTILRARHLETTRLVAEKQRPFVTKWVEALWLITRPKVDWQAVNGKQEEILQLHRETQTLLFHRWSEAKDYFTPEQQEVFWQEMRRLVESGEMFGEAPGGQPAFPPSSMQLGR